MTEQNTQIVQKPSWAIPGAIVITGVLISGAIYFGLQGTPKTVPVVGNVPSTAPTAVAVDITKVKVEGSPFIGKADAPITVAEWSDYQCPFCKRFDQDAVKQAMAEYISTGKVKWVFKDFAFLGADSQTAALFARAVWEVAPDKFGDWHTAMFEKQDTENGGWGSKADILILTKSLGIDSTKVDQLVTTKGSEYQKAIDADKAEGGALGINGTPGTIIGKQLLSGAMPYASVKQLVDQALQGK